MRLWQTDVVDGLNTVSEAMAMMIITFYLSSYLGVAATVEMWLQPCREFSTGGEFVYLSLCIVEK